MKHSPLASAILLLLCFSAQAQTASPENDQVKDGEYLNLFFGLAFTYPKDWVVHDEAINKRINDGAREEAAKTGNLAQQKSSATKAEERYPASAAGTFGIQCRRVTVFP